MIDAIRNEDAPGEGRAITAIISTDTVPYLLLSASTANARPAYISLSI